MSAEVIKEFLVALGFKVDEVGLRRFGAGVADATKTVVAFGTAIAATAASVEAGVARIASQLEDLYFASQRTGASVENIKALEFGVRNMGGSAEGARGSLEGLASAIRSNPGIMGLIRNLGVRTEGRDLSDVMGDLVGKFKQMPFYIAKQYAGMFGIDEKTLMAMQNGTTKFSSRYKELLASSGVNMVKASKASHEFMNELRYLGEQFDVLSTTIGVRFLPVATFFTTTAQKIADMLIWLDKKTAGWSTTIGTSLVGALAAALVAWKLLSMGFMATPLGAIVTAVVALAAGIALLTEDYLVWKEGGKSLIDWEEWEPTIKLLTESLGDIGTAFLDLGKLLAETFGPAVKAIVSGGLLLLKDALVGIADVIRLIVHLLRGEWSAAWGDVKSLDRTIGKMGRDVIDTAKNALGLGDKKETYGPRRQSSPSMEGVSDAVKGTTAGITSFFESMGWSKAQAAGLAANVHAESKGDPNAVGDSGKAFGIAQWHPDRQAAFKEFAGKDIRQSSLAEQLAFMHHELTEGNERSAGDRLRQAQTPGEAGATVSQYYERPRNRLAEAMRRGRLAEDIASTPIAPPPSMVGLSGPRRENAEGTTITNKTDIHVTGNDPETTAKRVAAEQERVLSAALRNLGPRVN